MGGGRGMRLEAWQIWQSAIRLRGGQDLQPLCMQFVRRCACERAARTVRAACIPITLFNKPSHPLRMLQAA